MRLLSSVIQYQPSTLQSRDGMGALGYTIEAKACKPFHT
jgi:hypothetical protein